MKRFFLILVLTFISLTSLYAQILKGVVVNEKGKAISNVSIYQVGENNGTLSNLKGEFEISIKNLKSQLFIECIGYSSQTFFPKNLNYSKNFVIIMKEEVVLLPEVRVVRNAEDPAYYIMRKAIAYAPYYLAQLSKYDCKVYLKGGIMVESIPWLIRKMMKKEELQEVKLGKQQVVESFNKVHYEYPDKITQDVIAIRSSEQAKGTSPMDMVVQNIYKSDSYGVASPLSTNSFSNYRYKLVGTFTQRGNLVNKIKITPRGGRKKGVFSGYIYIMDNYWNVHSLNLKMVLPIGEMKMKQMYSFVEKGVWMPTSSSFKFKGGMMGFNLSGNYQASISDYKVVRNPNVDHSILANELAYLSEGKELSKSKGIDEDKIRKKYSKNRKKIDKILAKDELSNRDMRRVNRLMKKENEKLEKKKPLEIKELPKVSVEKVKNDSSFWNKIRPIKLSRDEKKSFASLDSLVLRKKKNPNYEDSVYYEGIRFKPWSLLFGKTYNYDREEFNWKTSLTIPGFFELTETQFNTVDGIKFKMPFGVACRDTLGHAYAFYSNVMYALSRKTIDFNIGTAYVFNGMNHAKLSLNGGVESKDFKGKDGESSVENAFYSLLVQDNFKKFYLDKDINIAYSQYIANGLYMKLKGGFSDRTRLYNNSSLKLINKGEYSDNSIDTDGIEESQLNRNQMAYLSFDLKYTPRYYYKIKNNRKIYLYSNYPTYGLSFKQAFKIMGGDSKFSNIEAFYRYTYNSKGGNSFSSQVVGGKFFNTKNMYAHDYKFIRGFDGEVSLTNDYRKFRTLSYYGAVSSDYYIKVNTNYTMQKFLIKRLPWINDKMFITEDLFVNYVTTENVKNYLEVGYGIRNIFLMFDVEFVSSFYKEKLDYYGVRLNIKLK